MFSVELIQAISDWQRGGNTTQKAQRGKLLKKLCGSLPDEFKTVPKTCYRRIALDKKAVWAIGTKYYLGETISSWTTSIDVCKDFKGGVPPRGWQGIIFQASNLNRKDVIVNLEALFNNYIFIKFAKDNVKDISGFEFGMGKYWNCQREVVIELRTIPLGSIHSLGGYSNIFNCPYWLSTKSAVERVIEKLKHYGALLTAIKEAQAASKSRENTNS